MPPKAKEPAATSSTAQNQQDANSEGIENFELPRSLVIRLARSRLPENTKLQKEVVLSFMKASTVFINYLGATAHDVALSKQHKSISASDVLKALEMVGLEDMVPMLQDELQMYRDIQKADKGKRGHSAKGKARETESASASVAPAAKSKAKGKEKEKGAGNAVPGESASHRQSAVVVEADDDMQPESGGEGEDDEEMPDGDEDNAEMEMEDDVVDEDEDEDEVGEGDGTEPEDVMAVEDEELKRDAHALDDAD